MAYVTYSTRTEPRSALADLRASLAQRLAQFRTYRATVKELSALSDRDLADLGVYRADIGAIAQAAARNA